MIIRKPSSQYSVAAIYIKFNYENRQTDLFINAAPTNSGNAIDPETLTVRYNHIDITAFGKQFMVKAGAVNNYKDKDKSKSVPKIVDADTVLIDLLKIAHLAGHDYPELADDLNQMYDALCIEERNDRLKINPPTIKLTNGFINFVTELNQLVQNLLDKKEIDMEKFQKLIIENSLEDSDNEIANTVFTGIGIFALSHIITSFASGNSPLDFARNLLTSVLEDFMQTPTRNLVISAGLGALTAKPIADRLFNNKSAITLFAEKICLNVKDKIIENKIQLKH